ncbi:MAG: alpha/beta hydrolase [Candidatus Binatota bacterium]
MQNLKKMGEDKGMSEGVTEQPADRYFTFEGLRLHYAEWGDRAHETLILVHGNRDQSRSWDFFVAALSRQASRPLHIVGLDLRGHGDSGWSPPDRNYRHEDFLLDLAGLVRHLEKDSFTLVGHSLGGSMAMLFASCFPAQVGKLVLIEATGPYAREERDVPELLARWIEGHGAESQNPFYPTVGEAAKAIQERFPKIPDGAAFHMARHGTKAADKGRVWKYDPRMRFHSLSSFSENQIRAFIERIDSPTLLIYGGEGDFMKSPRASRTVLFKKGKVVEISGSGHHVPHEKPGELAEIVRPFLFE